MNDELELDEYGRTPEEAERDEAINWHDAQEEDWRLFHDH